jgi:hypothetical protein
MTFLDADPHPHPAAPAELKARFSELLSRRQASEAPPTSDKASTSSSVFNEFWEAPSRFWRPRMRELEQEEIDAVMVRFPLFHYGQFANYTLHSLEEHRYVHN